MTRRRTTARLTAIFSPDIQYRVAAKRSAVLRLPISGKSDGRAENSVATLLHNWDGMPIFASSPGRKDYSACRSRAESEAEAAERGHLTKNKKS